MKNRLMIFPCGEKEFPYIESIINHGKFEKIYLVIPKGIKVRENYRELFNQQMVTFVERWEEGIEEATHIWLTSTYDDQFLERELKCCKEQAEQKGKQVLDEEGWEIEKDCFGKETDELYRPEAIVVAVGEGFPGFQGSELICKLNACFQNRNWKVETVIQRNIELLNGMHPIPRALRDMEMPGEQMIIKWNRYIRYLDETFSPDIMFIQVPGGMLQFQGKRWDSFGLGAYFFFQAVHPDLMYVTVPFNLADVDNIIKMQEDFWHRYGIEVDEFFLSERLIDWRKFLKNEGVGKQYINREQYKEGLSNSTIELRNLWDKQFFCYMVNKIEKDFLVLPYDLISFQF